MLFDDGVYSATSALKLTSMLRLIQTQNAQGLLDGFVNAETGQAVNSFLFQNQPDYPSFYYAQSAGNTLLLINGVENLAMALAFYNGSVAGVNVLPRNQINSWCSAAAQFIAGALQNRHFLTPGNFYIAGYSAGGSIAEYYAAQFVNALGIQPVRISFGAPKAGGVNFYGPLANTNFALRWMNSDDPVPLIPPYQFPANSVYALGNPVWMTRAASYIHGSSGVSVNADGTYTTNAIPTQASFNPSVSIASWMFGLDGAPTGSHSLVEYARRIQLLIASFRQNQPQRVNEGPVEEPNPVGRREANAQAEEMASVIFATGAAQNAQPVTIPSGQPFFAFRTGRIWQVGFGSSVVAIGPTKKRARAMANAGNAMLRHLQSQGVVDPNAVLDRLNEYLQLASSPTGGFTPVMNITNPAL